jgi:hypothetical protein
VTGDGNKSRRTGRTVIDVVVQQYNGGVGGGGGRHGGTAGGAGFRETGDKRQRMGRAVIDIIVQGYNGGLVLMMEDVAALLVGWDSGKRETRGGGQGGR